jgi:hypothetical protein
MELYHRDVAVSLSKWQLSEYLENINGEHMKCNTFQELRGTEMIK